jgi:hypothetical protein
MKLKIVYTSISNNGGLYLTLLDKHISFKLNKWFNELTIYKR